MVPTHGLPSDLLRKGSTSEIGAKSSCLKIIKRYNRSTKNNFRENYSMLKDYIITKNLNLKIKNTEEQSRRIIIDCEDETEYYCPKCGSYHLRCKDKLHRHIKGISIGNKPTILRFKTHKYKCEECGHYFNANPTGLLKYQHALEACKREVFHRHCQGVSKKDIGKEMRISDSTVERYFQQQYKRKNKELYNKCPMVLGIDEHYFSKKKRYATTFVNLSKHKVFDVVLGRSEEELIPYLQKLKGKDKVRVIVMDLSSNYRSIAKKYFPNAMIVSDRFHVIKLVLECFIKTAYSLDKDLKKRFSLGRLLRKKQTDLSPLQQLKLNEYFKKQRTVEILYKITQELMALMNEKMCKYKDCKQRLVPKLLRFIELLKECGFELFRKLGKTMEYWQEEIGRMFRFTRTNGITEGFHRKMKLIQRRAYGFRNFENYRLRVRILCA